MLNRLLNWLAGFSPDHRELRQRQAHDRELVAAYARALREIAITTDGVKVPNGTTRKVGRIANEAFVRAGIIAGASLFTSDTRA